MTLPDTSDFSSYEGPKVDYSPVIDPTTDRSAVGVNSALCDAAAMTHTSIRAWVRMTLNGTAAPILVAHDSVWGNSLAVQPTVARSGIGVYPVTWPATVYDQIPSGMPGYFGGPHTVNLRAAWENVRSAGSYFCQVVLTSANVATVYLFSGSGATASAIGVATDTGISTDVDVFVL